MLVVIVEKALGVKIYIRLLRRFEECIKSTTADSKVYVRECMKVCTFRHWSFKGVFEGMSISVH